MHTPTPLLLLPFLTLLTSILTLPTTTTTNHTTSPWVAGAALDALIALNPHPFPASPVPNTTTTTSVASARLRPRDGIRIEVPIPRDPHHRSITVLLHPHTHPLVPYQLEACLTATHNLLANLVRTPGIGPGTVLPPEAYPLVVKPRQAMGAYVEIEEGEDGGMRVETLGLAVRGVWEGLVMRRRFVEAGWEIWYVVFLSRGSCFWE
ncbi:MAG: hypothetical protein Q9202_003771 [Teloschistes flavicans]